MMTIRLRHHTLEHGRFHVFTSPDLKGLHVSSEDRAAAEREVPRVVALILRRRGVADPVEFVWPEPDVQVA